MSAQAAAVEAAVSFQINRADVGPLFVDRLQLSWNPLCPLAEDLQGYRKGSARGSESLDTVVNHPLAQTVGAIVAAPDLRIVHRSGGGIAQMEALYACRNAAFGQETLVLVAPSFEDSILIRLFPDVDSYLVWWLDTFASPAADTVPNFMPPPLALESLFYLLHSIDVFRRVSYEGLLNYASNPEPSVKPAYFVSTMDRSVRSKDIRWLLPTFLQLTPGLSRYSFEPRAEHMDPLIQNAFVTVARDPKTNEETFLFGEGGRLMGVEFYRTWLRAVGFAPEILTPRGPRMLPAAFLAPTAISNHLIRLEEDASGKARANHQAMTLRELEAKMGEMLRTALATQIDLAEATPATVLASADVSGTEPAPLAATVVRPTCGSCGAALKPGVKFCPVCGKPVEVARPPSPAAGPCAKCGARNALGARFCRECGNTLSG